MKEKKTEKPCETCQYRDVGLNWYPCKGCVEYLDHHNYRPINEKEAEK